MPFFETLKEKRLVAMPWETCFFRLLFLWHYNFNLEVAVKLDPLRKLTLHRDGCWSNWTSALRGVLCFLGQELLVGSLSAEGRRCNCYRRYSYILKRCLHNETTTQGFLLFFFFLLCRSCPKRLEFSSFCGDFSKIPTKQKKNLPDPKLSLHDMKKVTDV